MLMRKGCAFDVVLNLHDFVVCPKVHVMCPILASPSFRRYLQGPSTSDANPLLALH